MFLKLGLIGHNRTIGIVLKIMTQSFPYIEILQDSMDTQILRQSIIY